ncbi:dual-specificity kinase [Sarracenia purpurea var. burkii]
MSAFVSIFTEGGTMQLNNTRPKRTVVPQRETSKSSASNLGSTVDLKKTQDEVLGSEGYGVGDCVAQSVNPVPVVNECQIDTSITLPSLPSTFTNTYEESNKLFDAQQDQSRSFGDDKNNDVVTSLLVESQQVPLVADRKKVQFSLGNNATSQGADKRMAIGTDNLLSHIDSLALTEMEWDLSNQPGAVTAINHDLKHQNVHNIEADISLQSEGANSSLLSKKTVELQGQLHQFENFLQGSLSHPMTQSSVVGSSCATTTLFNSGSAPMLTSMTRCSIPYQNNRTSTAMESLGNCNVNSRFMTEGHMVQHSCPSSKCTSRISVDQTAIRDQAPGAAVDPQVDIEECGLDKELRGTDPKESCLPKDPSPLDDKPNKHSGDAFDSQCQVSSSKNQSCVNLELSKSEKQENIASGKAASRKRIYDPELFFKVNGKLYQRLGKIGSGGSSEVHKVISSDCTIYALKKIKLKGRDYATAYGFCQEIEYLNKLKGKNHIIQLTDYEDEAILGMRHRFMDIGGEYYQLIHIISKIHQA